MIFSDAEKDLIWSLIPSDLKLKIQKDYAKPLIGMCGLGNKGCMCDLFGEFNLTSPIEDEELGLCVSCAHEIDGKCGSCVGCNGTLKPCEFNISDCDQYIRR